MKQQPVSQEMNQDRVKNILKFIDTWQSEPVKNSIFSQLMREFSIQQPARKIFSASFLRFSLILISCLLFTGGRVGAIPPFQSQEIDITTIADQINLWHLDAFKGQTFNKWIALGDVLKFNERIADGDVQAYIDVAYLQKLDANAAYVDCEGVGCATYMNDLVLADRPENVPAQTLWHEGMHVIFDSHDSELLVDSDEIYTWYVENVIGQALPWLVSYEKELAKGDKCDQKMLDDKWAKFLEKMQAARSTGYGSLTTDTQLEQLYQLTGFRVDPTTIRQNYVTAGMDKCPTGTPADSADLDLIFCIDVTGSMEDDIAGVKSAAANIVDTIAAKNKGYRVALIAYRDWNDTEGYAMFEDFAFSSDKAAIIAHINNLSVGGGDDTPEAVLEALMRAIDSTTVGGWRNNVNKQIILMGDAPPHDPSKEGLTAAIVAQAAEDADPVVIQALVVGNAGIYDADAEKAFEELARLTGGNFFKAEDASKVPAVLEQTIEDIQVPAKAKLPGLTLWLIGGLCLLVGVIIFVVVLIILLLSGRRRAPRPVPVAPYMQGPVQPYPPMPQPGAYMPPIQQQAMPQPGPYMPPVQQQPYWQPPQQMPVVPVSPPPGWQGETLIGMNGPNVAELIFEEGIDAGQRFVLQANMRLGRAVDNDIVLRDPQASRYHATLTLTGTGYVLADLGSANGVIVNGVRIQQPVVLRPGDVIVIGGERMRFSQR